MLILAQTHAALIVMLALIVLLGAVMIAAIIRYPLKDAKAVFGYISPVLALITGVAGTYFFGQARFEDLKNDNASELTDIAFELYRNGQELTAIELLSSRIVTGSTQANRVEDLDERLSDGRAAVAALDPTAQTGPAIDAVPDPSADSPPEPIVDVVEESPGLTLQERSPLRFEQVREFDDKIEFLLDDLNRRQLEQESRRRR
ncbi:MAG: hypothetical protein AAGB48_04130 [Planctomycetota bacterium]